MRPLRLLVLWWRPGYSAQAVVLVWIGVLHKLDVRALQGLGGGHYHHLPSGHLGEKHRVLVVDITRLVGNKRVYMGCGCWLVITYQERGLLNHTPTWHTGPPSVRWLRSYI